MEASIHHPIGSFNKTSAPRFRCEALFDPVAAWRALPPLEQEEIGAAAIAASVAAYGANTLTDAGCTAEAWAYEVAGEESLNWLDSLVRVAVLRETDDHPAPLPPVPDLRALGFQQCQGCGCTDNHACAAGCHWIAEDLCSECGVPENAA